MKNAKQTMLRATLFVLPIVFFLWLYVLHSAFSQPSRPSTLLGCSLKDGVLLVANKPVCKAYLSMFGLSKEDVEGISYHSGYVAALLEEAESNADAEEILETLIHKGFNINSVGRSENSTYLETNSTNLWSAALFNNPFVVKLLLEHGADPLIKDSKYNETPREMVLRLSKNNSITADRAAVIALLEEAEKKWLLEKHPR